MINKLWTGVSLENYNNWYPLTGKITETPQQYINTWPIANDWFKTFAIRAQNDINAYLDFILSKFPFDSFKDELVKETLRDMVYVMVEHWVFNRTPIEFNVDATIQFNNGTSFSANSIPTINVWDLAPSRMKIWARLTELKQLFLSYSQDDEIDVEKIDLKAFYTRNQVDELIKEQKEFTLSKPMKLYDDLVDDNKNEIYRGPVTNFINKGYVATDYDKETETMILDWPDEIGTLPPEALQNNPQAGDFTHAATCDFSAKQQKRITTNENEITKLNSELIKTNESIDEIKNNWFNIATSPLWKKMSSFIPSNEFGKIYLAIWGYIYQSTTNPTDNYMYSNKKTIFNLGGEIQRTTQKTIKLDELIVNDNVKIQLLFTKEWNDITVVSNDANYQPISITLYQYIGKGTPTEFIAEESTEHDYYTKQETDELLNNKQNINDNNLKTDNKTIVGAINENKSNIDKKQDKIDNEINDSSKSVVKAINNNRFALSSLSVRKQNIEDADLQTTDKTIVGTINELKNRNVPVDENRIFNNKDDKDNTTRLVKEIIKTTVGGATLIYRRNPYVSYDLDIPHKKYVDDEIKKLNIIKWNSVGTKESNIKINYEFKINTLYRIAYSWNTNDTGAIKYLIFKYMGDTTILDDYIYDVNKTKVLSNFVHLIVSKNNNIALVQVGNTFGKLISLEEAESKNTRNFIDNNIIPITPPTTPTPCPCPKWKEVGTVGKNKWGNWAINYNFKNNIRYKVYYNWSENDNIEIIKEFIHKLPVATNEITSFEDGDTHQVLTLGWDNELTIYAIKGKLKGKLWKLEELQE